MLEKAGIILLSALLATFSGGCQSGGSTGFQALQLINNARTAGLGGYNVSWADGDLALFFQNPAILDSTQSGDAVIMYNPFFADINAFTGQYVAQFPVIGKIGFGLTYVDYGSFDQTDATGAASGEFTARDLMLVLGKSFTSGPFTLGTNIKFIQSGISGYQAHALTIDLGGLYRTPGSDLTIGMAIRNLGVAFSGYDDDAPALPLQIETGVSFQPEGMPIRFSLTAHNFTDASDDFFDEDENPNLADDVLKRVSVGAEILISPNVHVLLGYDHNRKRELRLEETGGGAGFSYGFMVDIRRYRLRFSRSTFHAAGGTSFLSLQTNIREFRKMF